MLTLDQLYIISRNLSTSFFQVFFRKFSAKVVIIVVAHSRSDEIHAPHRHDRVVYTERNAVVSKVSVAIDDAGAKDSTQGADD